MQREMVVHALLFAGHINGTLYRWEGIIEVKCKTTGGMVQRLSDA